MAVRGPRQRIRAKRLLALIRCAISREAWPTACRYALAYQFLLRVPSELLKQFRPKLLQVDSITKMTTLGPLQRKTARAEV